MGENMSLPKHFNILMASAVSFSIAATTPVGLTPAFAQSAPAAEAPGDSGWQKEFELWRTSNKGGTAADYQKYLRLYPNGKFANVAKKRIEELSASAQTPASDTDETAAVTETTKNVADDGRKDLEMWRQLSKTGKFEDYQKYLKEFPEGKFAKVAKTRIENLTASAPANDQSQDDVAAANQDAAPAEEPQDQASDQTTPSQDDQPDTVGADTAQKSDQPAGGADWEQEYALWKAASDGNTVTEYEAYLRMYPDGKFAAIAQARIAQLAAAEQPDPTIAEGDQQDDSASKTNVAGNRKQKTTVDQSEDQSDDQAADQDAGQQPEDDQGQDLADQSGADDQQQENATVGGLKQKNQNGEDQQTEFTEGSPESEDAILDREARHELQGRLSSLGYDTLGTDGVLGERSRDAIASWQQDNGAPVTGYLSEDQVNAIFVASAATYATWLASRVPVRVNRVRPRTEWVVVRPRANVFVKRRPAVVVVKPFKNRFKNRVKVKVRFNGGCRKKRRC
jgi:hypothetical protein